MGDPPIQAYASRLADPSVDIRIKAQIVQEIRDSLDYLTQPSRYGSFLNTMVPIFIKLLEGPPVFVSTSPEQRLRNFILEIFNRMPMTPVEAVEPHAPQMVDTMMHLAKIENEENAVLCMKGVTNLQRHHAKVLVDRVQPFLDFIQVMLAQMEDAVKEAFDPPTQPGPAALPSTPSNASNFQSPRMGSPMTMAPNAAAASGSRENPATGSGADFGMEPLTTRPLPRALHSFKVVAECPIIIVSLFHSHRDYVTSNVREFVPLIKRVLLLQAAPQEQSHAEARAAGTIFSGISPYVRNRSVFGDFITAQVKTMSFLAYLLRILGQDPLLREFIQELPGIVVRLLKDCPRDRSAARKELLVAIRHIINFNYRRVFIGTIDDLLDERILIGDGLTVYEGMRPLAYSMLADLIHHVRDNLTRDQIRRTIDVYTRNLHDTFPGTSFQTMSAKLLLNMGESIARLPNKQDARYFLLMILNAIGDKFAAMNRQYANAVKVSESVDHASGGDSSFNGHPDEQDKTPDWDEIDIFHAAPIQTVNQREGGTTDPVADNKFLFKNLMLGLKNMFYQLKVCNPVGQGIDPANTPPNWGEVSWGYDAEEVAVITKLFREGASVFRYYKPEKPAQDLQPTSPVEFLSGQHVIPSSKEEKDLLEAFATVFHCIDPATFHEVFHSEIPRLYEQTLDHTALLHIPQFFLASDATSPSFAGMLLQFLMDHLDEVGRADFQKTSVLLRLFKLSFMAVTLFSTQNEQVLLPHVNKILTRSLELAETAQEPVNYFLLLRSLFRSIGGGRFELLYKEILPLVEMTLDVLNVLLVSARKPQERDLFVELCLTVPARLSNLIPHLISLMRPLVVALRGGPDLVSQGLRTLELCIDNLTPDYLDPIVAPFMPELMSALWSHLRPAPYTHFHSHTTMRILGKLGGRNRKYLDRPPTLEFRPYTDDAPSYDVHLIGAKDPQRFPADLGVEVAITRLMETPKTEVAKRSDAFHKQQAFRLISSQLRLLIGVDNLPDDFAQLVRLQANDLRDGNLDQGGELAEHSDRDRDHLKKEAQEETFKQLMKACIYAVSIADLRDEASKLVVNICRHLTILEIGRALELEKRERRPFELAGGEGPLFLDSRVLANIVVESLSSEFADVRKTAEDVVQTVHDSAAIIFGSATPVHRLSFFAHLSKTICHACHEESWIAKAAGTFGIQMLLARIDLGDAWILGRQTEFVRALMYVIKDLAMDLPAATRVHAQQTLLDLIRRCIMPATREDLGNPASRLSSICGYLAHELAHMNRHVRETAQQALSLIAKVLNLEVHELIMPVKDRLLSPIYNKPLRALPFATQIGYIDALTFCMNLQHGIVEFNDLLNRLLSESITLTDSEDEHLAAKPFEHRTAQLIVQLRVSCIRLLSLAMRSPEFGQPTQAQSRQRVISAFFKSLYSRSNEVIEAANEALKKVITQQQKLPKDLLQHGLRPILMNLQDYKRLTLPGLDGLARLLTLLTSYFKVGIGDMLVGHMETIAEPTMLQRVSFTLVEQNRQMKLLAAIINIFHLLPPAAVGFMDTLVNKVLTIEEALRRTRYSPFREPLIRFLNRYPNETWAYFGSRLGDLRYGRFFAQILASDSSGPVRDMLMQDVEGLLRIPWSGDEDPARQTAAVNVIHAMHSLLKHANGRDWIVTQHVLRARLLKAGKALHQGLLRDTVPARLRLPIVWADEQLMEILIAFMTPTQNLDWLFEIIEAVTTRELKRCYSLFHYIYHHIITGDNVDFWRAVVLKTLDISHSRNVSHRVKAFAFRYLVNPIFARDIMLAYRATGSARGTQLMDQTVTQAVYQKVYKPHLSDLNDDMIQPGSDHSHFELLQMSAMLLKYHHPLVADIRKDIIKFGWKSIRMEDVINKHAAYVVLAYFVVRFESPAKIVLQIYVALLRAYQNESRSLVMQALDLIASVLPERVGNATEPSGGMGWTKWSRKILVEDSSNVAQMMSIFQFLVRHPALFYDSRDQFIPIIVQSLAKIVPTQTPSTESKRLAVHLINLLWSWEERRVRGTGPAVPDNPAVGPSQPPPPRNKLGSSPPDAVSPMAGQQPSDYVIPVPLRVTVIKFLVQLISTFPEVAPIISKKTKDASSNKSSVLPTPPPDIVRKSLLLLYHLLSPGIWDDLDIDLIPRLTEAIGPVEPHAEPNETRGRIAVPINIIQIVRIIVGFKSNEWILAHLSELQTFLEKVIRWENRDVHACIHDEGFLDETSPSPAPLLARILEAISQHGADEEDSDSESPSAEFATNFALQIGDTLNARNYVSSINSLWILSKWKPVQIDQHLPLVVTAAQRLAREYLATLNNHPAGASRTGESVTSDLDYNVDTLVDLILKTMDILAVRVTALGENRRPFLIMLASLIEKSTDQRICYRIIDLAETWVFKSTEAFPTLKEKVAVFHKMLTFEARSDSALLSKFLDLVIRIYEDPVISRTELTVRLEYAFLIGTRAQDVEMRNRFMSIFDRSINRAAKARLSYVMTQQNWDTLAESFWINQAAQLMIGSIDMSTQIQLQKTDFTTVPPVIPFAPYHNDPRAADLMLDDNFLDFIGDHARFCAEVTTVTARDVLEPLSHLQHQSLPLSYEVWTHLFPLCWATLSSDERTDLERGMLSMLSKDYHQRQMDKRPNVIQAILEGVARAKPRFKMPPHVLKYLTRTFEAWYTSLVTLEDNVMKPVVDTAIVRESTLDALVALYAGLREEDLFYGTWRRRSQYVETNAALSYEQFGIWGKAQELYEAAQIKARTGVLPFSQGEYMVWEDHWVICAQKLQQWDLLHEFAKHENFNDLLLECAWRTMDLWHGADQREWLDLLIKGLMDAPTPRRAFFQAFMSLLKVHAKSDAIRLTQGQELRAEDELERRQAVQDFNRNVDEAVQLSIHKWHQLPPTNINAHIPLLHNFQELVELHDASLMCTSLAQTTQQNLDNKSQELKLMLASWRERLPNIWDDINAWQDLVTWRQHIFHIINKTYLSLVPQQGAGNTGNSFAYRGYHETAWIINRFAHVARKHQLTDVCISQLSRIYTLPNIEIQEAFLKLREQAKCHYQSHSELSSGLDVIHNTNLNYFAPQQKAEFYTLKGMFLEKLGNKAEANDAFGSALYFDIKLAKAWAAWGQYNDNMFKEKPNEIEHAAAAVGCYLEAAGLFKNPKSRKMLARVLWLMSLDDPQGSIAQAFDDFRGETPVWYWVTFLPQLLTTLSQKEARLSKNILVKVAKVYPQALFFLLRTSREDHQAIKKKHEMKLQEQAKIKAESAKTEQGSSSANGQSNTNASAEGASRPSGMDGSPRPETNGQSHSSPAQMLQQQQQQQVQQLQAKQEQQQTPQQAHQLLVQQQQQQSQPTPNVQGQQLPGQPQQPPPRRHAWEYTEEIMSVLKTAFPLLALSMETVVDQIAKHFKCPPDEDAYRLIVALLNDGLSYVGRTPTSYTPGVKLPAPTEANIDRFAQSILPAHIRKAFEADFVTKKPTMHEYINKLRRWRDKFEERLDRRPFHLPLEGFSLHMSDFRFQKFDEVEIPGQYLELKEKNHEFIRIERFMPDVDLVRHVGSCHRRVKIRGHDGSLHSFAIQHPAARHCRREERIVQLFRILNSALAKKKESRRRNLTFHLPLMIPLAPHIRIVQDDPTYSSLQAIYEDHCRRTGTSKDEPILFTMNRLLGLADIRSNFPEQSIALRLEIFKAVQERLVPLTIVFDSFSRSHASFSSFWLFRRQFSYQLAAVSFMTHMLTMNNRYPHKLIISRATGNIWASELLPSLGGQRPVFFNAEHVPFRLTPNLQILMGPIATEGIFAGAMMALARCLTEPEYDLGAILSIFVRDEIMFWFTQNPRSNNLESQMREIVEANCDAVVKKIIAMTQPAAEGIAPVNQSVIDLISKAARPALLAQSDILWMPYL
ncbi:MAG: hypothetical protein M1823_001194 [Watsoniomyces obsoletus]|nr:MAG: hypothetical protein M1823_001194 [Watsoniomyces obsoletus]